MTVVKLMASLIYLQVLHFSQLKMKQITVYSIKVKIVTLHFKIRALANNIIFSLALANQFIDSQEVQIKNGLLVTNVTLSGELKQTDKDIYKQITIVLAEHKHSKQEIVGKITIPFSQFTDGKLKKIKLQNCFDSSAYLESFLLLIPSRIIDEQLPEQKSLQPCFQPLSNINSTIKLKTDSDSELTFSNLRQNGSEAITKQNRSVETQTYSIESLLAQNQQLSEANQNLSAKNEELQIRIKQLQKVMLKNEESHQTNRQLQKKIEELNKVIKSKEVEIAAKNQNIQKMAKEKEKLTKELEILRTKTLKPQFKIDNIVSELGKYSETAKKYKFNQSTSIPKATQPKLSESIISESNLKQSNVRPLRNRKQELKLLLKATELGALKSEETLDTMRQSLVNVEEK